MSSAYVRDTDNTYTSLRCEQVSHGFTPAGSESATHSGGGSGSAGGSGSGRYQETAQSGTLYVLYYSIVTHVYVVVLISMHQNKSDSILSID
jgi:hypothetical protein